MSDVTLLFTRFVKDWEASTASSLVRLVAFFVKVFNSEDTLSAFVALIVV